MAEKSSCIPVNFHFVTANLLRFKDAKGLSSLLVANNCRYRKSFLRSSLLFCEDHYQPPSFWFIIGWALWWINPTGLESFDKAKLAITQVITFEYISAVPRRLSIRKVIPPKWLVSIKIFIGRSCSKVHFESVSFSLIRPFQKLMKFWCFSNWKKRFRWNGVRSLSIIDCQALLAESSSSKGLHLDLTVSL